MENDPRPTQIRLSDRRSQFGAIDTWTTSEIDKMLGSRCRRDEAIKLCSRKLRPVVVAGDFHYWIVGSGIMGYFGDLEMNGTGHWIERTLQELQAETYHTLVSAFFRKHSFFRKPPDTNNKRTVKFFNAYYQNPQSPECAEVHQFERGLIASQVELADCLRRYIREQFGVQLPEPTE